MKGPIIHIAASMTVWPREALEVRTVCGVQGMLIGTWRQHEVNEARNALGQVLLTNIFESNLNMPTCLACVELFNQQPRNPWDHQMASGIPKRERLERIKVIVDGAIARSKRPNKEKSPAMTFVRDELTPDELARIYALACNQPEDWRP